MAIVSKRTKSVIAASIKPARPHVAPLEEPWWMKLNVFACGIDVWKAYAVVQLLDTSIDAHTLIVGGAQVGWRGSRAFGVRVELAPIGVRRCQIIASCRTPWGLLRYFVRAWPTSDGASWWARHVQWVARPV